MVRKILIIGMCFCIIGTYIASSVEAKKVTMKIASGLGYPEIWKGGPPHPYAPIGEYMVKRFAELSNGEIEAKYFPMSQLGGDREMQEMVMAGTLEMVFNASTPMATVLPEIGAFDMPYMFKGFEDLTELWNVLDGPFGHYLNAQALKKNFRIVGIGFTDTISIMTRNKPINKLEDLNGLKIRTMESPLHGAIISALGAKPIPMPWPEVYMALAQGVIDGVFTALIASTGDKQWEVYKYFNFMDTCILLRVINISEQWFQSLSPIHQLIVLQVGREGALMMRTAPQQIFNKCMEYIETKGVKIIRPPREQFVQVLKPIQNKFMDQVGGKEIVDFVEAAKKPITVPNVYQY